ncbi:mercury(II) reductase [Thermoproteus tenax]|uniref:Mercuric reductase n=2 Tax=Thermoproteus tenax TaxID=2271 RepID=G4RND3_THETK|nr:mercury(II) reductase [Thermoproteus tenax]CAF18529.1 pyruvate/2-oxoglutarate dehydrogenase complex, dihydrolipoamide, related enzymes and mecuric reductase [Thermoproteus tenax]CCC81077.1 pyruvate/2-oxoglutarate dehydrogenase complex dihydrolipoamide dehydrogenase (E3) component [Thermoproteus tenax Kra 1]
MTFDLVVLGGGSAGFAAAIKAAQLGASVAMINDGPLGGTCVNVGCVPSKYLVRAGELMKAARAPYFRGIRGWAEVDGKALMAHMRSVVEELRRRKYADLIDYYDIKLMEGRGMLVGPGAVKVGGETVVGRKIVVATGARAVWPQIKGLEEARRRGLAFSNEEFFSLEDLPNSVVFIGGGAISVELGQALSRLGMETYVIYRSRLLKYEEALVSDFIEEALREDGVKLIRGEATAVEVKNNGVEVRAGGVSVEAEAVFVATGRRPNVEDLGGLLKLTPEGAVEVNRRMETSVPGIYAAGDVTGGLPGGRYLENVAARQGVVAAVNALGGSAEFDAMWAPRVVFSDPPVASVGLREEDMIRSGVGCACRLVTIDNAAAAWTSGRARGFIKINTYPERLRLKGGRIAGALVVSPHAEELINIFALAVRKGLTVDDIADWIPAFPSFSEALRLAALAFTTDPTKLSCCGG